MQSDNKTKTKPDSPTARAGRYQNCALLPAEMPASLAAQHSANEPDQLSHRAGKQYIGM